MLDDLYLTENIKTAQDAALRPPPVPKQAAGFSAWRTATALPRGVVAGGAQAGAGLADVLGAFGPIAQASGMGEPSLFDRDAVMREADRIQKMDGQLFTTGDEVRRFAEEFRPDPETAHTAERLVFDFARVASKAVGYTLAAGPVGGATLTAGDEAMAVADELKQQGVDLDTRTKVGAVVGAVTGLGVGLPMAGNTLRQTVGLVALGGPVSFVAQQQAVRSILQSANYDALAEQYDPLDPVGLAVSTLIPAGFGAWGLRAARARQVKADAAAKAQADADFAAGPVPSEQTPVAMAAREATAEQVDAARVMLSRQVRESSNPARVMDDQTMRAHDEALTKAGEQIARGERVSVGDVAPSSAGVPVVELKGEFLSAKVDGGMVGGTIKPDGLHITFAELDAEQRGQGQGIAMYSALVDAAHAQGLRVFSDATVETPAVRVYEALQRRGYELVDMRAGELAPDANVPDGAVYGKGANTPAFEVRPRSRVEAEQPSTYADWQANITATAAQARAELDTKPQSDTDPFSTSSRVMLPEISAVADQLRGMGEGAFWAVEGGRLLRSGNDTPGDGGMGGEVIGRTPWVPADEWFGRMRNDMGTSGLSNQGEIKAAIEKAIEGQPLNAKERRTIDWMRGELRDMEAKLWELDDADQAATDAFSNGLSSRDAGDFALTARASEIDADAVERAAIRFENDGAGFMAEMRRIADGQDRQAAGTASEPGAGPGARGASTAEPPPADARGPGPEQQPAGPDATTRATTSAEARLVDDATARQADALMAEQPDMLVMLDGMDAPRRLSDVLADIKAEVDDMKLDADLMEVAALCALQNGS